MKQTQKKFGVLGIRADRTRWLSENTFFKRKHATVFKKQLSEHVNSRLEVVELIVTTEVVR